VRLLDLFCGAGGATRGYQMAGFHVVGVDLHPQPNYVGDEFHRADAMTFPLDGFDAIHASPPCQAFTAYQRTGNVGDYPDLVAKMRKRFFLINESFACRPDRFVPWVIENVVGAPLVDPVMVCGTMFDPPMEIQRHRLFETNWDLRPPDWPCRHKLNGPDRYPGGRSKGRTGTSTGLVRRTIEIGAWDIPLAKQQEAMGIDWMTLPELSEAIPPAYTEHIGRQLVTLL
jgi:DNA (cytosine-5)-methyltransferase 1